MKRSDVGGARGFLLGFVDCRCEQEAVMECEAELVIGVGNLQTHAGAWSAVACIGHWVRSGRRTSGTLVFAV